MSEYWLKEIDRATTEEGKWVKRGKEVVKRYKDERAQGNEKSTKFNILWANTETMRPALISATPRPEIRPRYRKKDPVVRVAAKILERALEFSVDQYNFVKFGKKVVQDYLLPGRAVARVKYTPVIEKKENRRPLTMSEEAGETVFKNKAGETVSEPNFDDEGAFTNETTEEVVFEEVEAVRVPWQWFRMEPADEWANVNWIAFGAPYTKSEGLKKWGKKFLDATEEPKSNPESKALDGKVIVWEVWDKRTRKQLFVANGLDEPLEKNADPMRLERFYPIVEPVYIVEDNDTMIPTPEFTLWQDQADELDLLSERIRKVTDAIKARGAYAGEKQQELTDILDSDDNQLIPISDWMAFIDKGGLDGLISWVPIEQFAKVLQILETQRATKIQEIYELTGVSDIQRGATDPRETAKAQQLKANFGNRRLATKQDDMQVFFRDLYRLKAEIIAEQFDPATLKLMVGLESENELFDEAVALIKSDVGRAFNVEIETDSTIAIDEEKEKQGLAEAMQAVATYLQGIMPLVQTGAIPMPVAMEILKDYLRRFRFGRKLDELLEEFAQQQLENPQQKEKEEAQKAEQAKMQAEMKAAQEKHQMEMQALQAKSQAAIQEIQQKLGLDQKRHEQELDQDEEKHQQELRQDEETHDQKLDNLEEQGVVQAAVKLSQPQGSSNGQKQES